MTSAEIIKGRAMLPVYEPGERNRCPGCGRFHWYIGRQTAMCAFCDFVMPLPETSAGGGTFRVRKG